MVHGRVIVVDGRDATGRWLPGDDKKQQQYKIERVGWRATEIIEMLNHSHTFDRLERFIRDETNR
jgi:hypothetical protein